MSVRLTRFRAVASALAIGFLVACAKGAATTPTPQAEASEGIDPPRMLSRGSFPHLNITGPSPSGRPVARIHIRVMIDPSGRPEMTTLRVSGIGAGENRLAIERWIADANFRPAMRNGQPVRGLFEARMEARVTVRRIE